MSLALTHQAASTPGLAKLGGQSLRYLVVSVVALAVDVAVYTLLVQATVIAGLLIGQVFSAPAGAAVDGTMRYSPTIVHRHVS